MAIVYHKKTILSIPLKYTPEEARKAIERVMGAAEPQKPHVKQYQTTQGMIKKQLSDTTKDKKYSKHVAADIVKSFSGRELLKSKDITEIVQFLWEGLNDYSDSEIKHVRPAFYC